jgi:hypothetical protein
MSPNTIPIQEFMYEPMHEPMHTRALALRLKVMIPFRSCSQHTLVTTDLATRECRTKAQNIELALSLSPESIAPSAHGIFLQLYLLVIGFKKYISVIS